MKLSLRSKILLCGLIVLRGMTLAQEPPADRIFFNGGLAVPSGPQSFTDYWNMGLVLGVAYETTLVPSFSILGSVDYSYYSLNEERYFEGIDLPAEGNTITGGGNNIVTVMGSLRYFPTEEQLLPLYLQGGLGAALSWIGSSAGDYSGLVVEKSATFGGGALMSFGAGLMYATGGTWTWDIGLRYQFGLFGSEHAQDGFFSVRVGAFKAL